MPRISSRSASRSAARVYGSSAGGPTSGTDSRRLDCGAPPSRIMMQASSSRIFSFGKRSASPSCPAVRSFARYGTSRASSAADTGTCCVELASCSKTFCSRRP